MKREEIHIRDPYVLLHEGKYYLYGTRGAACWGKADGFDCYVSEDLERWSEPIEIFRRPDGFWADRNFWAPECYFYQNQFYLVTTFGASDRKKGIQVLFADQPTGPFIPLTDGVVTPKDWDCIDGTLYLEIAGTPYLVFSHSFEDEPAGQMCRMKLSADLKTALEAPVVMTTAAEAPWAIPIPFAKSEFGMEGAVYFTDGPSLHRMKKGDLAMIWSSWGKQGYAVGVAYSDDGTLGGKWHHEPQALFPENGGHGMVFTDKAGNLRYALHYPNTKGMERPVFNFLKEHDEAGLGISPCSDWEG